MRSKPLVIATTPETYAAPNTMWNVRLNSNLSNSVINLIERRTRGERIRIHGTRYSEWETNLLAEGIKYWFMLWWSLSLRLFKPLNICSMTRPSTAISWTYFILLILLIFNRNVIESIPASRAGAWAPWLTKKEEHTKVNGKSICDEENPVLLTVQ